MNVPTRTEFSRAVARIDALERELADAKRPAAAAARAQAQGGEDSAPRASASRATREPHRAAPRSRRSFLGARVLRRLARGGPARAPASPWTSPRLRPRSACATGRLDFTEPASDQRLLERAARGGGGHCRPRRVLHRIRAATPATRHELESIGTLEPVLAAAAAAGVEHA